MTFREVLQHAAAWRSALERPGSSAPRIVLMTRDRRVVEVDAALFSLVLKALVVAATRGCKAIQGVTRERSPYATMILDDYAAQREADDAARAGLAPEQAGVRSLGALGHKHAMSATGAASAARRFLTEPAAPRVAFVPPKGRP